MMNKKLDSIDLTSVESLKTEHLRLSHPKMRTILRIHSTLKQSARDFLVQRDFMECQSPNISFFTDQGARGAHYFYIDFYGIPAKLTRSAMYVKWLLAKTAHPRIFMFSPNFRVESSETFYTNRHLVEFEQIDVEMRGATLNDVESLAEELHSYIYRRISVEHGNDLKNLGREVRVPKTPYKRLTHWEAVEILSSLGEKMEHTEIPWDKEELLSRQFDSPFIMHYFPWGSRGPYDREGERPYPGTNENCLLSFDILEPYGFGEVASGSERENYDKGKYVARIMGMGEDPSEYIKVQKLIEDFPEPTAGFGFGVERLLRAICGQPTDPIFMYRICPRLPNRKLGGANYF